MRAQPFLPEEMDGGDKAWKMQGFEAGMKKGKTIFIPFFLS